MILADTTIWIDHFRGQNEAMRRQLDQGGIVIHPFIIGELALGSLRERSRTLEWLEMLPQVRVAQLGEVRGLIEARALHSRGIGLIDAHLIASCLLDPPTLLWTKDRRLGEVAGDLGVCVKPS